MVKHRSLGEGLAQAGKARAEELASKNEFPLSCKGNKHVSSRVAAKTTR
jgi:hypothetical protein